MPQDVAPAVDGVRHQFLQVLEIVFRQMEQIVDGRTVIALEQVAVEDGEIV